MTFRYIALVEAGDRIVVAESDFDLMPERGNVVQFTEDGTTTQLGSVEASCSLNVEGDVFDMFRTLHPEAATITRVYIPQLGQEE